MARYVLEQSPFSHFFTADNRSALLWLVLRIYVGYEWFIAGWEKLFINHGWIYDWIVNRQGHFDPIWINHLWIGSSAGAGISGFVQGALHKTAAFCLPAPAPCHPDVQTWYATFLQVAVQPHSIIWSYAITFGELAVGLGLIFGILTGAAAFFGGFMNLNFMLAGTVSINPILFTLAIGLVLARRVAGHYGLDYWILKLLHRSIRQKNLTSG